MRGPRVRGAAQVLIFNWPKVLGGVALAALGGKFWSRLPWAARCAVLGSTLWTPVSLLASWWVYDLSPLRHWRFVRDGIVRDPARVLLVVAEFDEVSPAVGALWPAAELTVVDVVVDPEPSVRRARRWYPTDAPVIAPAGLGRGERHGDAKYDVVLFAQSGTRSATAPRGKPCSPPPGSP